jgi:DNA polymerase III delta prime subunit
MANDKNPRALVDFVVSDAQRAKTKIAEQEAFKLAAMAVLEEIGKLTHDTEDGIEFKGEKIILPATYDGNVMEAAKYLRNYHLSQEKHYEFSRVFDYRPLDGAHAFQAAMKKVFGTVGIGKNRPATLFSPERPPQMRTIDVGVNATAQVPWGEVDFPTFDATFGLGATMDPERGVLFVLSVDAPKKFRRHLDALFQVIEKELQEFSIYKGKAITGAQEPGYVDLSKIDPKKVIYSDDVLTQLDTNLWSLLRYTELQKSLGLPLKRAVLLEGPYGTGKTLAGTLTAKEAVEHGWTFILCRSGQDNLFDTLKTAQIYAPAVVWFEDIDKLAKGGTDEEISKLLDALDGAQNKGHAVVAGFTTNHINTLQKGVLRPGRLDAIIHIGQLDASGYEKLVRSLIPEHLLGDIDYTKVVEAMDDFMPAFVTEAINNSLRYTITRTKGHPQKIETTDIVNSAAGLRAQHDLMNNAGEGANKPTVDSTMNELVATVVQEKLDEKF